MKVLLYCLSMLLLLAGCDSADKPEVTQGEQTPAASQAAIQATPETASANLINSQTTPSLPKAEANLANQEISAAASQLETVEITELAIGVPDGEADSKVASTLDTKKFKRFTPDPREVARKTNAHTDAKGPALTAPDRRVTKPAADAK